MASISSTIPFTPPTPTQTTELRTLHALLHLLYHRNRNQHRRSIWWRSFATFRRQLGRLLAESDQLAALVVPGKGVAERRKAVEERLERRVGVWTEVFVARWYISFTHLTASSQFAAIGLVLLAALARTSHLLGITAALEKQADAEERRRLARLADSDADEMVGALKASGGRRKYAVRRASGAESQQEGEDMGTVIRRRDVLEEEMEAESMQDGARGDLEVDGCLNAGRDVLRADSPARSIPTRDSVDTRTVRQKITTPSRKKKRRKLDAIDELFSGLD